MSPNTAIRTLKTRDAPAHESGAFFMMMKLCDTCNESFEHAKNKNCEPCLRYFRLLREKRREANLCNRCPKTAAPFKRHCTKCLAKMKRTNRRRRKRQILFRRSLYQQRVSAGICPRCAKAPRGSTKLCNPCRLTIKKRYKTFRRIHCGLCGQLGHNRAGCDDRFAIDKNEMILSRKNEDPGSMAN